MKHKVTFTVNTNYNVEEITGVIEKLLAIPLAQYEDCNLFDYKLNEIWTEGGEKPYTHSMF